MSTDEQPQLNRMSLPVSGLGLWAVLGKSFSLYRRHCWAFTRALLPPVIQMTLGVYCALGLSLLWMQWVSAPNHVQLIVDSPALVVAITLGIALLGLFLFSRGLWVYLLYWVSLCHNVADILEGREPDVKAAFKTTLAQKKRVYASWLAVLCLLSVVPVLPQILLPALGSLLPDALLGLMLVGFLLSAILGLGWLLVQLIISYGTQIIAFEAVSNHPFPIMRSSARLFLRRPWLTLGLQVVLYILTNYLLILLPVKVFRLLKLASPLDDLHAWLSHAIVSNWTEWFQGSELANDLMLGGEMGFIRYLEKGFQENQHLIAQGLTDYVLNVNLTLLLLPLGTIAFTLMYLQLRETAGLQPQTGSEKPAEVLQTEDSSTSSD